MTGRHSHHSSEHVHAAVQPATSADGSLNRLALSATLHCLTGCGIGEALGLVIANALHWRNAASITLAVILAFLFGYGLTLRPLLKGGMGFLAAGRVALAADTISIIIMELVDNVIMLLVPGAMEAALTQPLFWSSLILSLIAAFVAAYPVNRWLIARGRGHAIMHTYHH